MGACVCGAVYGPFLQEAAVVAARGGRPGKPIIACVVLDEGDGRAQFARWAGVLREVANCEPVPVLMNIGAPLDVSELGNADGLLVCGGLTPGYAASMAPAPRRYWTGCCWATVPMPVSPPARRSRRSRRWSAGG